MTNPLIVAPRTRVVTLYPGGVEESLEELQDRIEEAVATEGGKRVGAKSKAQQLAEEYDAKAREAKASAKRITLTEVPHRRYRQIQDENPPRKGNRRDEALGFDEEGFLRDLVQASISDPVVTEEQFDEFADSASEWNWKKLTNAAWELANSEADLPKPLAASVLRRMRERESKQPDATA